MVLYASIHTWKAQSIARSRDCPGEARNDTYKADKILKQVQDHTKMEFKRVPLSRVQAVGLGVVDFGLESLGEWRPEVSATKGKLVFDEIWDKKKSLYIRNALVMSHQINLYFIRHAHVAYYTDQGSRYTVPHFKHHLTPLGWAQALELDYLLAQSGIKFAKIYSSPYARAVETITPFSIRTQKSIEIKWDLREVYTGASYPIWYDEMIKNPHQRIADGESKTNVIARFSREIHEILKTANPGDDIIVVSHGAIMECFLEHVFPNQKINMVWPDAYNLVFKHGHFSYLKRLESIVPNNISTFKDLTIYPKLVMGEE